MKLNKILMFFGALVLSTSLISCKKSDPVKDETAKAEETQQETFAKWCRDNNGELKEVPRSPYYVCEGEGCPLRLQCKYNNGFLAYSK